MKDIQVFNNQEFGQVRTLGFDVVKEEEEKTC